MPAGEGLVPLRALVLAVFLVTGAAGLVYEVAWARLLTTLFGASSPAIASVLAAYMVGLTLGSVAFGRWIDRRGDALLVYAGLESGTAAYATAFPWLVSSTTGLYALLYQQLEGEPALFTLLRFLQAFALLLPPTFLMGGTLPVLTHFLSREARTTGRQVALLYGLNTLGAALGCAASGFLLVEALGVTGATHVAAVAQVGIAAIVVGARGLLTSPPTPSPQAERGRKPAPPSRRGKGVGGLGPSRSAGSHAGARSDRHNPQQAPSSPLSLWERVRVRVVLALATIGYSGFAALALETLWSRVLTFFLGNTVYAFAAVLTTMLAGIALGSLLVRPALRAAGDPLRLLGALQAGIGLAVLVLLPALWQLNAVHRAALALAGGPGWWQLTFAKFAVAFVALVLPTLGMGASFPCAAEVGARAGTSRGRLVGNVYAVNSLCGAIGSVVAGFGLAPLLGAQRSIALVGVASVGVGVGLLALRAPSHRRRLAEASALVAAIAVLLAVTRVDRPIIAIAGLPQAFAPPYRLVDYREGADATVAVLEDATGVRELSINGVSTAFTSTWDLRIHKLLAHLPLLLHPEPRQVLVVGYGMGVTARSTLRYPTVQRVDVAEISGEVVEVSPRFAAVNAGGLGDPRLHLIMNDGKNHLLATDRRYDVITANAIHPGVAAGNGALYTVDFYQAARGHLTPDGVVCQWLPIHQLSTDDVRSLVRSFQVVFPHTTLWFASDFALLVGTPRPLALDLDQLATRMANPAVAADLAELGDLAIGSAAELAGYFLMDEDAVARYVAGAALNTDDHPVIEFSAPRSAYLSEETNLANLRLLREFGRPGGAPVVAGSEQLRAALATAAAADEEVLLGQIESYAGRPAEANAHYLRALTVDPASADARYLAKRLAVQQGIEADRRQDLAGAAEAFGRAVQLSPDYAEGWYRLAVAVDKLGRRDVAVADLARAVQLNPRNARWRMDLAGLYVTLGRTDAALDQLRQAVAADPEYGEVRVRLAMLYRRLGRNAEAEAELAEALRLENRLGNW